LSSAYVIMNKRLNLEIVILDISKLLLHEETIPELLKQLSLSIRKVGCLNHPIIVDKESLLVLDGVHRVAALKKLGFKRIPACFVDYKSPAVQVFNWYRAIGKVNSLENLLVEARRIAESVDKVAYIDKNAIGTPPVAAALRTISRSFLIIHPFESPREAYDIIKRIEERLKIAGFEVTYETESDARRRLSTHQVSGVLYTPRLTKKAIIETARSGKVFTYKATRHIIPARPLRLCIPLSLLKNDMPLNELNETLKNLLLKKKVKHLPPGSLFEGRRYEEDLYVFDEEQSTAQVKVRLLGVFRGRSANSLVTIELKQPTVGKVLKKLMVSLPVEAKRLLSDPEFMVSKPNALILVNGKEISVLKGLETEIKDGDEVTLIPVSHGG
jgi:MoaD family protein